MLNTMHVCILLCSSINRYCGPEGGMYGGPGGDYFDDGCEKGKIFQVRLHVSSYAGSVIITAITTNYVWGFSVHGLPGGELPNWPNDALVMDVGPDEAIVAVVGNAGDNEHQYLNKLGFIVMAEDGSTTLYGPVGETDTGDNFIFCGQIRSFRGRSGWAIDAIGFNTD